MLFTAPENNIRAVLFFYAFSFTRAIEKDQELTLTKTGVTKLW